jgi:sugar phosphate isomerase/epimerase
MIAGSGIRLGADTLCWHLRIERGGLALDGVLDEAAAAGAECLQVNLHHVRDWSAERLSELAAAARARDVALLASGDVLGQARSGDDPSVGSARVARWLEQAAALRSPILRVVSGFYRAELAGRPAAIEAERRYVVDVLRASAAAAEAAGIRLLLENHSDFTSAEYKSIVDEVGEQCVGVFLDLINPVAALEDPLPVVRQLAPLAAAGHVKDYEFTSIYTDDRYHRRGFEVRYRYPGEGVADLPRLIGALRDNVGERSFFLSVEGLDNHGDRADQRERLARSFELIRRLLSA